MSCTVDEPTRWNECGLECNARLVLDLNAFAPLSFALVLGYSSVLYSMHGGDGNSLAIHIT